MSAEIFEKKGYIIVKDGQNIVKQIRHKIISILKKKK